MELYQLAYFVEVARQRNITHAANRLHVAQPALSQQIQKLEAELGAKLFIRGPRQTTLSPAGEAFLPRVKALLAMAEAAKETVAEVTQLRRGRLVIASIPSLSAYWLPKVIREFRKTHPNIELTLHEETSDGVAELVEKTTAEIGFLQLPVTSGTFESTILMTEDFLALLHGKHPLAKRRSIQLCEIKNDAFVLYKGKVRAVTLAACRAVGFEPRIACETSGMETIRALVAARLGVSLVPRLALTKRPANVVALPITEPKLTRELGMILLRKHELSTAAKAFISFTGLGKPGVADKNNKIAPGLRK